MPEIQTFEIQTSLKTKLQWNAEIQRSEIRTKWSPISRHSDFGRSGIDLNQIFFAKLDHFR